MTADGKLAQSDAAYLLGALTSEERVEYEQFLSETPERVRELTEFADILDLLDLLPHEEALALLDDDLVDESPGSPGHASDAVASLAAAAEKRRNRGRRKRLAAMVASAAVFLVVGGLVGYAAIPHHAETGVSLQAMTPGHRPGVEASLGVTKEGWGTRLDWQCRYTKGWAASVASYDLVVTTTSGHESVVASWRPAGDHASNLAASTVIPLSQIRDVTIRVTGTAQPLATTAPA